jgi:hypothetical protein
MTPQNISNRLQNLYRMYREIRLESKNLLENAPEEFMGDIKTEKGSKRPLIITQEPTRGSYSKDYPDANYKATLRALRNDQLPLYINEQGTFKDIIVERLKGIRKEIPIRQDLIDTYEDLEKKAGRCLDLFIKLEDKIKDLSYKHAKNNSYNSYTLILIGNHEYLITKNSILRPWDIDRIQL